MKLSLSAASVKEELKKLCKLNDQLKRLFNSTASGYPAQGKLPRSSKTLPPDILRQMSMHANDIHDALYDSYRCECLDPHEANLGARHISPDNLDLSQPLELLFPVGEETAKEIAEMVPPSPTSPGEKCSEGLEF